MSIAEGIFDITMMLMGFFVKGLVCKVPDYTNIVYYSRHAYMPDVMIVTLHKWLEVKMLFIMNIGNTRY